MRLLTATLLVAFSSAAYTLEKEEYAPLAEGAEWTMDVVVTYPNGNKATLTMHRKVEAIETHKGKEYYRGVTRLFKPGAESSARIITQLVRKDAAGLYTVDLGSEEATEQTELLLPLQIGKNWMSVDEEISFKVSVVAVETVTIAGKVYENCFHIRMVSTDGLVTKDYWHAPNTGVVKQEATQANGVALIATLKKFKPGKK